MYRKAINMNVGGLIPFYYLKGLYNKNTSRLIKIIKRYQNPTRASNKYGFPLILYTTQDMDRSIYSLSNGVQRTPKRPLMHGKPKKEYTKKNIGN
jgi:hypothetical protein